MVVGYSGSRTPVTAGLSKTNFQRSIIVRRLSMKALVPAEHITEDDYANSTLMKQKLIDYINDILVSEGYKNEFPRNKPNETDKTAGKKSERKPVPKVPMENADDLAVKNPGALLPILKVWIQNMNSPPLTST